MIESVIGLCRTLRRPTLGRDAVLLRRRIGFRAVGCTWRAVSLLLGILRIGCLGSIVRTIWGCGRRLLCGLVVVKPIPGISKGGGGGVIGQTHIANTKDTSVVVDVVALNWVGLHRHVGTKLPVRGHGSWQLPRWRRGGAGSKGGGTNGAESCAVMYRGAHRGSHRSAGRHNRAGHGVAGRHGTSCGDLAGSGPMTSRGLSEGRRRENSHDSDAN